jgi:hypothetical protein
MTWQKHQKHPLLTAISSALASVFPPARTSLDQPFPVPQAETAAASVIQLPVPGPRRAKIIPFPASQPAPATVRRNSAPMPILFQVKSSLPTFPAS